MTMDKTLLAEYLQKVAVQIPSIIPLLSDDARVLLGVKALISGGDLPSINASYHDAITRILTGYYTRGNVTAPRNEFNRAVNDAFNLAFELGWKDGGGGLPIDEAAQDWLNARIEQEFGYVKMMFTQAKQLRKDKEFDFFAWVTERADGYTRTLKEIYNTARLMAMKDQMVTFDGDDGEESCPDCQRLKGKRHRISWFINNNYVPPFGAGLECHPGRRCQHGLMNDKGEWLTV